jgi:hypothetical protein
VTYTAFVAVIYNGGKQSTHTLMIVHLNFYLAFTTTNAIEFLILSLDPTINKVKNQIKR